MAALIVGKPGIEGLDIAAMNADPHGHIELHLLRSPSSGYRGPVRALNHGIAWFGTRIGPRRKINVQPGFAEKGLMFARASFHRVPECAVCCGTHDEEIHEASLSV